MTTNNLLSDKCTICALELPLHDGIADYELVCKCANVHNTRGEQCAMAAYRATLNDIDSRLTTGEEWSWRK